MLHNRESEANPQVEQEREEADLQALLDNPDQHTPAHPECSNPYCPCHFNAMREEVLWYAIQ